MIHIFKQRISLILAVTMLFAVVSVPITADAELSVQPSATVSAMVSVNPQATATSIPSRAPSDVATEPPGCGEPPVPTPNSTSAPTASAELTPDTNKLKSAKKEAKAELKNYLDIDEYSAEDKELIKSLFKAANKDINKLKSVKEVKAYVKLAKKVLDDIPTLAELQGMTKVRVKFAKQMENIKLGRKFKLKVKLKPSKGLSKDAKKVKWSINKEGKKVIGFVKMAKKLQGKLAVKVKAKKKGEARITCKSPNGRKAVCKVVVK